MWENSTNAAQAVTESTVEDICSNLSFLIGQPLHDVERLIILETLRQQSNNRTRTAKVLKIGIRTLQRKLKQYNATMQVNENLQVV